MRTPNNLSQLNPPSVRSAACLILIALLPTGCGREEPIEKHRVSKPDLSPKDAPRAAAPVTPATEPQQILVGMVVVDTAGWFFKLSGSQERVAKQEEQFRKFLGTVKFTGTDKTPKWTLPEGWTEGQAGGIRFATIVADGGPPPLELAVTRLEKSIPNDDEYVISNMNRWREQVNLPEFADMAAVQKDTTTLAVDGHTFFVANFAGQGPSASGMGHGTFAGNGLAHPSIPDGAFTAPAKEPALADLKFALPEGWKEFPGSPPFSYAKFKVERDGKKLEISISTAGGTLLSNVNRWREQLGESPIDDTKLGDTLKPIELANEHGQFVELTTGQESKVHEAILAAIAAHGGKTWFVKLRGDAQLAQDEKARFEQFLHSLQLP